MNQPNKGANQPAKKPATPSAPAPKTPAPSPAQKPGAPKPGHAPKK